jgi:hypothetical protein
VEAHPQVIGWMREDGWHQKPNVEIVHSRWEDVDWQSYRHAFDGVYFDVFPYFSMEESDRVLWFECVRTILKPETGVAMIYNTGTWPQEKQDAFVAGFFRDHVTVGWTRCEVEVPFLIDEWERRGLGVHEVQMPYFSLSPKLGR